jgi:LysM repeat protein/uncharacterized protein YukE
MSWLSELWGIIDPGGSSTDISLAAQSWQELAADLRQAASSLDPVAAGLRQAWKGAGASSYQQAWSRFNRAVVQYADNIDGPSGVPATLRKYADELDNAHAEARKLIETIEVSLAVGVGLTFVTFGLSDAAADATAATAAAVAADSIAEGLDFALTALRIALQAIAKIAINIAARFVMGYTFAWAETSIDMLAYGEDPFDPANWSADLVAGLIVRGMVTAVMGTIRSNFLPANHAIEANPELGNSIYFALDGAISSSIQQFAVDGNEVDTNTLGAVGLNTVLSAFLGHLFGQNNGTPPGTVAADAADDGPDSVISGILNRLGKVTGITKTNVLRSEYRAPASIIQHGLNFTFPPAQSQLTSEPSAPREVPVPRIQPPEAPAHTGGGTDMVKPGDTLWGISSDKLNNPADYPLFENENPTVRGGLIFPGQKLDVPVLPVLPPGYTIHVVQAGDTVYGLAGGDPVRVEQIARLNGLADSFVIIAGRPLILPPGT